MSARNALMGQFVLVLEVTKTVHVKDNELFSSSPSYAIIDCLSVRSAHLKENEKQRTNLKSKPFHLISGTFTCGTSHGSSVLIYQLAMMDGRLMMPHLKRQAMVGIYFCQSQQNND